MEELALMRKIEAIIAAGEEINPEWLHSPHRGKRYLVIAKQIIQYYARVKFHLNLSFVGAYYGRDHCQALNSIKVVTNLLSYDRDFRAKIAGYDAKLAEGLPGLYDINVIKILQDGIKVDYEDLKRRMDEIGELIKKTMPNL